MRALWRGTFVVLPLLAGTILPAMTNGWFGAESWVNLFWGTVYGLGWLAADLALDINSGAAYVIGFFLWPMIMTGVLAYLSSILPSVRTRPGMVSLVALATTLCVNAPEDSIIRGDFTWLPHFYKYFAYVS